MTMQEERRSSSRFPAALPVRFKGNPNEADGRIMLQDISAQGAKLISRERFFMNDYVSLEVKMPATGEIVELHGQVVWISTVEPQVSWNVGLTIEGDGIAKLGGISPA